MILILGLSICYFKGISIPVIISGWRDNSVWFSCTSSNSEFGASFQSWFRRCSNPREQGKRNLYFDFVCGILHFFGTLYMLFLIVFFTYAIFLLSKVQTMPFFFKQQELQFDPENSIHYLDLLPLKVDVGKYILFFEVL